VVVAAIAPKTALHDKAQPARILVTDLAGGTSLGQSGDGEGTECDSFPVGDDARADFVWMSDISGSTDDERIPIQQNASAVFTRLDSLGIDFRMGVVKHTANHVKYPASAGQLLGGGFTRTRSTFEGWWADTTGSDGQEYGLTAVDDVVGPTGTAMPRSAAEQATKVREGVKLVVVYVSDEHAQEVEYGNTTTVCGSLGTPCGCAGITDNTKEDLTASELTCVQGKVQSFLDHLATQDAIAFGIIAPPPGGCDTRPTGGTTYSQEVGWGYSQVIAALGGSYGSVCASDPGQTLDDIVSAVAGATSSLQLTGSPIAITLKAIVTPAGAVCDPDDPTAGLRELSRSQLDGFDYDPVNNTVYFVGPSRPQAGDTVTVSYREWTDQTEDPDPDPIGCTDCGGCGVNQYCNTTSCLCEEYPG
jgi:hypothetical protein